MNDPLVSVVIPVFNGEKYLAETLRSVLAQDYPLFEVIVVDDGSTDGSTDIVRRHPEIRYAYQDNKGVPEARNAVIGLAKGDFIAFLDQDDLWLPDKLSKQVDAMMRHPGTAYVTASQVFFLEPRMSRPFWLKPEILDGPQTGFTPSAVLFRRSAFERTGVFNTQFPNASDVDWFFRAKDAGIPMIALSEVLVHKRVHPECQSSKVKVLHAEYLRIAKASIGRQRRNEG